MKVAGIVVCNPDYNRLLDNIKAVYPQVDNVVVYLNSKIDKCKLDSLDNLQYLNDGCNKGIATALNTIMDYADKMGADWCLLLDQDSIVSKSCIEKFESYKDLENVAILSPVINDDRDMEKYDNGFKGFTEIDMCITSGSYNNIEVWKKVKKFRDEYFIDYVDWEYCARVRFNGYKVYRINELTINHQLGAKTYHRLFGRNVFTYNHNAFRKYYITRNTIVTYKLFPNEVKFRYPYLRTLKRLVFTILFEKEKIKKTRAILHGLFDSGKLYRELKENQEYGY